MEKIKKEAFGLTSAQVEASRTAHGANVYNKQKRKSFMRRLLDSFSDPIIRILLIALGVNLLFTIKNINWAETIGIVIAVLISTFVSAISEYGSEKAFDRLQNETAKIDVRVLRDGRLQSVPSTELVVGDLILLNEGERIMADGLLIEGELSVNEAAVNGESEPAHKKSTAKENDRRLYAGSLVSEGEGQMRVTAVGADSVYGHIAEEIQTESGGSPLKNRLSKLAGSISKIGYAAAALVALTYLFNVFVIDSGFQMSEIVLKLCNLRFVAMKLIKAVTIAMTVVVVAVPEGLPMMITVVLSSNMKKMMRDKVLVRKMVGIETAGCMNILFTDKTGTLTEGKPVCKELVFADGSSFDGKSPINEKLAEMIERSIHLNSSCTMIGGEPVGGNATEQALCRFFPTGELPKASFKQPFNSKNKYSYAKEASEEGLVYFKGASEKILPFCKECYDIKGCKAPFDRAAMQNTVNRLSSNGARVLVMATGRVCAPPHLTGGLTFLCLVHLADGLRENAKGAVDALRSAGIHTVMITGDSYETASRIAKECGIIDKSRDLILTGSEMEKMSDREVMLSLDRLAAVARALPSDKTRLVEISRKKGLVVGMTGDGVNDAPALKNADVGFAMGSGSEIAKEAGDLIILDNDLSSIVKAVLYGRTVFKSIRKFITFQLIMNLCAVGITLIGQLMGIESPVTVVQMLWVNMIMDTLGGLAFSGEFPQKYYLLEKPISRHEPILKTSNYLQILMMGGFGTFVCSMFLSSERLKQMFAWDQSNLPMLTAFFALFIFTGIVICFTTRSERVNLLAGLWKNKPFAVIMTLISFIQLLMLYFGGETFRCVGLKPKELLLVLGIAASVLPVDLIRRLITKALTKKNIS